jgi:hypothetical protein
MDSSTLEKLTDEQHGFKKKAALLMATLELVWFSHILTEIIVHLLEDFDQPRALAVIKLFE